ncbi:Cox family DNA-binding protein, partial [Klebsiella pneumoniae]
TEDFARTMPEYCGVISKSPTVKAVKGMIEKGKLPVIEMTDPQSTSGRAGEYWVMVRLWLWPQKMRVSDGKRSTSA